MFQNDLATILKVHSIYISRIKREKKNPSPKNIKKIQVIENTNKRVIEIKLCSKKEDKSKYSY